MDTQTQIRELDLNLYFSYFIESHGRDYSVTIESMKTLLAVIEEIGRVYGPIAKIQFLDLLRPKFDSISKYIHHVPGVGLCFDEDLLKGFWSDAVSELRCLYAIAQDTSTPDNKSCLLLHIANSDLFYKTTEGAHNTTVCWELFVYTDLNGSFRGEEWRAYTMNGHGGGHITPTTISHMCVKNKDKEYVQPKSDAHSFIPNCIVERIRIGGMWLPISAMGNVHLHNSGRFMILSEDAHKITGLGARMARGNIVMAEEADLYVFASLFNVSNTIYRRFGDIKIPSTDLMLKMMNRHRQDYHHEDSDWCMTDLFMQTCGKQGEPINRDGWDMLQGMTIIDYILKLTEKTESPE